jgi:hypothetical protein
MFSVCVLACVIFPTNTSPLLHLIVNIPPAPHHSHTNFIVDCKLYAYVISPNNTVNTKVETG